MWFAGKPALVASVSALLSLSSLAAAQAPAAGGHYQDDRSYCLSGRSPQDQRSCLREAGAARVEARRGTLVESGADYEKNRFARCEYHRDPAEKEYCVRRMRGEGTVSGSEHSGAIVRELVVTVPAESPSAGGATR